MKRAILRDTVTGKAHDLTALVKEHEEVSVGRKGYGSLIGLDVKDMRLEDPIVIKNVSREHATILYDESGEFGEGFYIRDHSKNGTHINNDLLMLEKGFLKHGDKIWFGDYGPVEYKEVEDSD